MTKLLTIKISKMARNFLAVLIANYFGRKKTRKIWEEDIEKELIEKIVAPFKKYKSIKR